MPPKRSPSPLPSRSQLWQEAYEAIEADPDENAQSQRLPDPASSRHRRWPKAAVDRHREEKCQLTSLFCITEDEASAHDSQQG